MKQSKEDSIRIRIPVDEKEKWRAAARQSGMTLTMWIKVRCSGNLPIALPATKAG